jgi:hypothetical protein
MTATKTKRSLHVGECARGHVTRWMLLPDEPLSAACEWDARDERGGWTPEYGSCGAVMKWVRYER